jgi:hypothetical protein
MDMKRLLVAFDRSSSVDWRTPTDEQKMREAPNVRRGALRKAEPELPLPEGLGLTTPSLPFSTMQL